MIIKIERNNEGIKTCEFISDVIHAKTELTEQGEVLTIDTKNTSEYSIHIPLTYKKDKNSMPALVSSAWLMNDNGKTIDRII